MRLVVPTLAKPLLASRRFPRLVPQVVAQRIGLTNATRSRMREAMDHLRTWIGQHSNLVSWLGLAVVGILGFVRIRGVLRSAGAPVRVPASLNRATRFRPPSSVFGRVFWFGLIMAVGWGVFSVPILIEVAFRGRYYECGHSSTQICDWLSAALINPVAAGLMGGVLGAGWPLMRRLWTAVPVGIIAVIPFLAQFAIPDRLEMSKWNAADTVLVLVGSIFMGPFLGYVIWKRQRINDGSSQVGSPSVR